MAFRCMGWRISRCSSFFVPLFGNFDDLSVEFREMDPKMEESAIQTLEDYSEGSAYVRGSNSLPLKILKDNLLCWDIEALHRTLRSKKDIK